MALTLRITNMTTLPDGGATQYSCDQGRFEIGRDPGMDWTLPDPNRFVSSCHAEIRFENGGYWLYDVSTNGTFVNGASMRVKSPYQIQSGDKLQFGQYIVEADVAAAQPAGGAPGGGMSAAGPFGGPAPAGSFAQPAPPDPFGGGPGGDPFGAPAPGGDPFGAPAPGGDPFGSSAPGHDPFASGGGGAAPGAQDDPWSIPGVAAADGDAFGRPVPPPSHGDAGDEMMSMDFGRGGDTSAAALGQGSGTSPFGQPAGDSSPFGTGTTPPQPAPPAAPPAPQTDSPFGGGAPGGDASPFGGGPPPAPHRPPPSPPSEGFHQPPPAAPPPPAAAPQAPAAAPARAPAAGGADGALLRAICEGAGLRPDALNGMDPTAAGYEIGQALRVVASELAALLRVRSEGKQRYERSSRTMIGREANNPLKFIPTSAEALEVMFGQPRQGYLRGPQTMQSSFDDIKRHQYAVQAALQPALARLLEDLSPEAIEDKIGPTRFGSKAARSWELFVERWDAKTHPYENGMLDVFQAYYSDAYHDASRRG